MTVTTTLKALRDNDDCVSGYNRLVRTLQGRKFPLEGSEMETHIRYAHKEPIPLRVILDSNGLDDALWSLRACDQTPEMVRAERLFAVWCARQVQHLMTDQRSLDALDVSESHAYGEATDEHLAAARDAARDAALAAARGAARDAQKDMFIAVFCGDQINIDAMKVI